ncbi:MAG: hypothetical protein K0U54_04210 [Bacteroidetes bacterium]|nr:hypothetical protein [Bacteroidota bacterium]
MKVIIKTPDNIQSTITRMMSLINMPDLVFVFSISIFPVVSATVFEKYAFLINYFSVIDHLLFKEKYTQIAQVRLLLSR